MTADDPILARRARIARWAQLGQRVGYGLFGVAIALFVIGFATTFSAAIARAITAAMVVGSIALAPAIVASYAVRAAEREDQQGGNGRSR